MDYLCPVTAQPAKYQVRLMVRKEASIRVKEASTIVKEASIRVKEASTRVKEASTIVKKRSAYSIQRSPPNINCIMVRGKKSVFYTRQRSSASYVEIAWERRGLGCTHYLS